MTARHIGVPVINVDVSIGRHLRRCVFGRKSDERGREEGDGRKAPVEDQEEIREKVKKMRSRYGREWDAQRESERVRDRRRSYWVLRNKWSRSNRLVVRVLT